MCWSEEPLEEVSGLERGGGSAAGGAEQVLRCLSALICCDSLSRSYFVHLVTQRATLAQSKGDNLKPRLSSLHSLTPAQAETPLRSAGEPGEWESTRRRLQCFDWLCRHKQEPYLCVTPGPDPRDRRFSNGCLFQQAARPGEQRSHCLVPGKANALSIKVLRREERTVGAVKPR